MPRLSALHPMGDFLERFSESPTGEGHHEIRGKMNECMYIYIYIYISADPSPFSRGRRKEWRRRRVGLLVVDVLLIPCALSWRRSGV